MSSLFTRIAAALLVVLLLLAPAVTDAMVAPEVVAQAKATGQTIGANNIMPTTGAVLGGAAGTANSGAPSTRRRRTQPQAAATVQNTPVKSP
jgi:hypothetical protein